MELWEVAEQWAAAKKEEIWELVYLGQTWPEAQVEIIHLEFFMDWARPVRAGESVEALEAPIEEHFISTVVWSPWTLIDAHKKIGESPEKLPLVVHT